MLFRKLKSNFRKSFVTITVVILSLFFVTVLVAVNVFNSQVSYSNERNLIDKQVYYNAYAGIQRAIYEIRMDYDCEMDDYFIFDDSEHTAVITDCTYYTRLRIVRTEVGNTYVYSVESTGYGNFHESVISQTLTAKITVDYTKEADIIRIGNMHLQ